MLFIFFIIIETYQNYLPGIIFYYCRIIIFFNQAKSRLKTLTATITFLSLHLTASTLRERQPQNRPFCGCSLHSPGYIIIQHMSMFLTLTATITFLSLHLAASTLRERQPQNRPFCGCSLHSPGYIIIQHMSMFLTLTCAVSLYNHVHAVRSNCELYSFE